MSFTDRGIFQDEKAATVVFGTLMIILVTITVVSSLALMASLSQKNAMERQSVLEAAENENLKIVTIKPTAGSLDSYESNWESLNITVMNLDILDSDIAAISINDDFMINYFLIDENGNFDLDGNGNPKIYNVSKKITVPTEESIQIHVGGIPILGTVHYNGSFISLNNSPSEAYPNIDSSGWLDIYDSNNTRIGNSDFTVKDNQLVLTNVNLSIPENDYIVKYTTFLNYKLDPHYDDFQTTRSIKVEIISERTNLFSKRFMPPNPIAEIQVKSEIVGGIPRDYLLLDASNSNAPDGFITSYRWEVYNSTGKIYGFEEGDEQLSGIKARPTMLNLPDANITIDLEVKNNYGMVSRLSDISGNKITIY